MSLISQFLVVALKPSTAVPTTPRGLSTSGGGGSGSSATAAALQQQRFEPFVEASYPSRSVGVQVERVERFCFPDADMFTVLDSSSGGDAVPTAAVAAKKRNVSFTFVLTDGDGRKCFGFCRRFAGDSDKKARPLCLALLTTRAWFSVFVPLLERLEPVYAGSAGLGGVQQVVDYLNMKDIAGAADRQQRFVTHVVPLPDGQLLELRAPRVSDNALDDVPYVTLFKTLFVTHVLQVFEALLFERRIIFVSKDYTRLSHCIFAAASLLFPFQWQHIFIPILPRALLDVCCAPMPFVVGVHVSCMPQLQRMPLESIVFVDLDANAVTDTAASAINAVDGAADGNGADGDDDDGAAKPSGADSRLPMRYVDRLRTELDTIVRSKRDDRHALAAPFMSFFVTVFHNYAHYIVINVTGNRRSNVSGVTVEGEKAEHKHMFALQRFIRHHPSRACAQFLTSFCQCQMFEQFIDERLEQLETAEQLSSQFDTACDAYAALHRDVSEDNYAAVKKQVATTGERLLATWRNTQKRFSPAAADKAPPAALASPALAPATPQRSAMGRSESVDSLADDAFHTPATSRSIARESAPPSTLAATPLPTPAAAAAAATPAPAAKPPLLVDLFGDAPVAAAAPPSRTPSAPLPTPGRAASTPTVAALFDLDDIGAPVAPAVQRNLFGSPNLLDTDLLGSVQPFKSVRRRDSGHVSGEVSPLAATPSGASSLLDFPPPTAAPPAAPGTPAAAPKPTTTFSLLDL